MNILIAGGSGLLGKALTQELIKNNHQVTILSRQPLKQKWIVYGSKLVQWNPKELGAWAKEIAKADAVINLAGANISGENLLQMRWSKARKKTILESRKTVGQALLNAVKNAKVKPKVFLQSSAVGYYGPSEDEWINEKNSPGTDFLAKVCQEWEDSSAGIEKLGITRIVVRTGLVFAREAKLLSLLMLPFRFFAGGKVGSGNQFLSWIHIDDWVAAVIHLLTKPSIGGVYNLTAPHPVTNRDFAKTLGKVMRRPSLLSVPGIALKLGLGEAATLALDGQRVRPEALLASGYEFQFPELKPALHDLLHKTKIFKRQFKVNADPQAVIAYHRNTSVLKRLTPFPIMVQFRKVEEVDEGSRALFTLWFGPIPVKWAARHHDLIPEAGFSDTQDEGPFKLWIHQHRFFPISDNVSVVQDQIEYQFGERGLSWLMSRFMGLTLPILFGFRKWRTKRDLEH